MTSNSIQNYVVKTSTFDPRKNPNDFFMYIDVSSVSNKSFKIESPSELLGKDAPSRARKLINKNDVLVATVRPTLKRIAIVPAQYDGQVCSTAFCVLRTKENQLNPKYLFFSLLSENFISYLKQHERGANYPAVSDTVVKEYQIDIKDINEQQKIAYVLSVLQKAIELQDKAIQTTTELKNALMQKLFTEGLRGEKQKETEIGMIPESWEVIEFQNMVEFSKRPKNLVIQSPISFIPMDLVPLDEIFIKTFGKKEKVSSGTFVKNGDILLAKITPSFENGKQGILDISDKYAYATTEVIPFREKSNVSDKLFLFYWLKQNNIRQELAGKMEGATGRQRLNKSVLDKKKMPRPSLEEQTEISNIFSDLDKKIQAHRIKKQRFEELFLNLLQELMTGQTRVHHLEFNNINQYV